MKNYTTQKTKGISNVIALIVCLAVMFTTFIGISLSNPQTSLAATVDYAWYGDGKATTYNISTPGELIAFSNVVNGTGKTANSFKGKTINLTADIEMAQIAFTPIGISDIGQDNPFEGTFNGKGHIIKNLSPTAKISNPTVAALFHKVKGGKIMNLGLDSCFIRVEAGVNTGGAAGIVAICESGVIINCFVIGTIELGASGQNSYIGGIIGKSINATVKNCYFYGNLITFIGQSSAAGIVGLDANVNSPVIATSNFYDNRNTSIGIGGYDKPTAAKGMTRDEMRTQVFADTLNKWVTAERDSTYLSWAYNKDINSGCPKLVNLTNIALDETVQSYVHDGNARPFVITSTPNVEGFTITYYVSGEWSTIAPTRIGEYDVKIVRAADNTYAAVSKTIARGLIITEAKYTITYDANGATSGTAPIDNSKYSSGFGILKGKGDLAKTGYTFGGWNVTADGSGGTMQPNNSVVMFKNYIFYAIWIQDAPSGTASKITDTSVVRTDASTGTLEFVLDLGGGYQIIVVDKGATAPIATDNWVQCLAGKQTVTLSNLTAGEKDVYIFAINGDKQSQIKITLSANVGEIIGDDNGLSTEAIVGFIIVVIFGLLLILIALYVLWKYSILKGKIANTLIRWFDPLAIKICKLFNKKQKLFTIIGTKDEQKDKKESPTI